MEFLGFLGVVDVLVAIYVVALRELQGVDRAARWCPLLVLDLERLEVAVISGAALKLDLPVVIDHGLDRFISWLYLEALKLVLVAGNASEWHSVFVLRMLVSL